MLPAHIGLASRSTSIDFPSLVRVAAALSIQVSRDLAPIWGVAATVTALEDPDHIDPGVWPVFMVDQLDPGMGGFHQTEHNQPYAMVQSGDSWSLAASHEVLEMLVDPSGNRLVAAPAVAIVKNDLADSAGKFEYLVEICDPSEDESCAYLVDGVLVSDFYTPNYFDPTGSAGARYSFSGRITRPRQVLANGYLSWFNPATNQLQQARHFGAIDIITLGQGAPGGGKLSGERSLRGFVDSLTPPPQSLSRLHRGGPALLARDLRQISLTASAPRRASFYKAASDKVMETLGRADQNRMILATQDAKSALADHLDAFARPGILSVRPGWRASARGGLTLERAIVATVLPERLSSLASEMPKALGGIPIDLRPADALQQMRSQSPERYLMLAAARHELRQPDFADQTFFDADGKPLAPPAPLEAFSRGHAQKEEIPYSGPADARLDDVTGPATLLLHVSPDAGWDALADFLATIPKSLVVGMYDFTSAHVVQAVEKGLAGGKSLTLTLDHPAPNKTRDQTDEQTRSDLQDALGDKFAAAWALTNSDPKATKWIYPNAYHIKVAVRDDDRFWLSSGNWNNSNQPVIDLTDRDAARQIAAKSDRDWHVIVGSKRLADMFRAFLQHDYDIASQNNVDPAQAALAAGRPDFELPESLTAAGKAPLEFFAPKTISDNVTIEPLLTPDNYQPKVLALINQAQQKFYMQTQYIHPSGRPGDEGHDALIAAVKAKIDAGLDVRLITSQFQTADWVEKLVDAGLPMSVLRRQANVHNKGIVVDSAIVLVSSQNWSADGTLRNRDAGLIIHHPDAATYFETIFLHDWNNLASPVAAS